jgi:hypothetical protein
LVKDIGSWSLKGNKSFFEMLSKERRNMINNKGLIGLFITFLLAAAPAHAEFQCVVVSGKEAISYEDEKLQIEYRQVFEFDGVTFLGEPLPSNTAIMVGSLFGPSMQQLTKDLYVVSSEWKCETSQYNLPALQSDLAVFSGSYEIDVSKCGQDSETSMLIDSPAIYFLYSSCLVNDEYLNADGSLTVEAACASEGEEFVSTFTLSKTMSDDIELLSEFGSQIYGVCN